MFHIWSMIVLLWSCLLPLKFGVGLQTFRNWPFETRTFLTGRWYLGVTFFTHRWYETQKCYTILIRRIKIYIMFLFCIIFIYCLYYTILSLNYLLNSFSDLIFPIWLYFIYYCFALLFFWSCSPTVSDEDATLLVHVYEYFISILLLFEPLLGLVSVCIFVAFSLLSHFFLLL